MDRRVNKFMQDLSGRGQSGIGVLMGVSESGVETLAGGFAGICQVFVGHPFDTIKVRMQTQVSNQGALGSTVSLVKSEGISGLYKGVTSPVLGIALCNSVLFAANGFFKKHICIPDMAPEQQLDRVLLSGMLSGGVMAFINCPVELLKVRMQVQDRGGQQRYKNIFDCAWKSLRAEGPSGLFRGLNATLLRDLPSFAGYFFVYEAMKAHLHSTSLRDSLWTPIISGGCAGIAAWLPCYPQDVLKSRIQSSVNKVGLIEATATLFKTAGMKGFYKGFTPTMIRAFPANAATFLCYEFVMSLFKNQLSENDDIEIE